MSTSNNNNDVPVTDQLGTLATPTNLLKTIASQVPFASAGVEMLNQLEGERVKKRITVLEQTDLQMLNKLREVELSVTESKPRPTNDWPAAAHEYFARNVDFVVLHNPSRDPNREYILPIANGCLIGDDFVLTCSEALKIVDDAARLKGGSVALFRGLAKYGFEAQPVDKATGLVLCKITGRDERRWEETVKWFERLSGDADRKYWELPQVEGTLDWTVSPWIGQEIGFVIASDSKDNLGLAQVSHLEFGTSIISHFKQPKEYGLKVFVTTVFGGRIRQLGSAVFSRDGTLLGIISGAEKYEYDAGRRAVVKSLLGMPRFTKPKIMPVSAAKG